MKSGLKKLLSAALAAALLTGGLPARASDALGHDLAAQSTTLHEGVTLTSGTFWSDSHADLRQENYVVYTPNERVTPLVACNETARTLRSVPAAAKTLEAAGARVVAGVNGDYYDTQYGLPIGSTMSDGTLRNASSDRYCAVGFRADGTAVIGDPQLSLYAAVNGGSGFPVFAFNYLRQSDYGIFLYDHRFNERGTTGTSESGVDVVCSVEGGALTIGGTLALRVDEVLADAVDTAVPEGKFVLTTNLRAGSNAGRLLALAPGDRIDLSVTSGAENAADWESVTNLIGAPLLLVENGAVVSGLAAGSAPRTAVGQRADGSLIFYTIDGRRAGYSIGASLTATAMRLVELGCVTAAALDGGGSTTLVASLPDETGAGTVNLPSDGGARPVSNQIFLVADGTPSGRLDHVWLAPSAVRALPGAQIALRAAAVDTNYLPTDDAVTLRSSDGTLSGSTLTLPETTGTVTVTARSGGRSASAEIAVLAPERIVVKRGGTAVTALTLPPNGSVSLTAEGVVNHLALAGDNRCFTWTYAGDGVTLSDGGSTLTAGSAAGAGTLTVSAGGQSVSIPVTVARTPQRVGADFEAPFAPLVSPDGGTTLSHETSSFSVHNGRGAARLDYAAADPADAEAFAASVVPVRWPVPGGCDAWSVWYRAEAQSAFTLLFDNGARADVAAAGATDWQLASGRIPAGARAIVGVAGCLNGEAGSGTVQLDQLVFSYGGGVDSDPPAVSLALSAEANALTGRAFDAVNGATLPTLRLTLDRAALAFTFDSRTGALTAALPAADGRAHHIALTAGDAAGNLARADLYLPAANDLAPAFPDVAGHWAAGAVEYMKRTGLSIGNDLGLYCPDANITRQEFALMLCRYLKPTEDFSGAELPFHDAAAIAPWALEAARAMYCLGVVGGGTDEYGRLCYLPLANISRQEAATMLGRLLEQGYAAAELPYADRADVAPWAARHAALLASLGVFDGFVTDRFSPAAPLTRAEMASLLLRIS